MTCRTSCDANYAEEKPLPGPAVIPVFVTIDPSRDTIGQLKHYSHDFDSRFQWLTGTQQQIETVTKDFRVYIGKVRLRQP
jgi:cytochrome oxidase Cu insertion factor (SCO1/SenC/PrrC family)